MRGSARLVAAGLALGTLLMSAAAAGEDAAKPRRRRRLRSAGAQAAARQAEAAALRAMASELYVQGDGRDGARYGRQLEEQRRRQSADRVVPCDRLSELTTKLAAGPVGQLRPGRLTMQYSDGEGGGGGTGTEEQATPGGQLGQPLLAAAGGKDKDGNAAAPAAVHVYTEGEMAAAAAELQAAVAAGQLPLHGLAFDPAAPPTAAQYEAALAAAEMQLQAAMAAEGQGQQPDPWAAEGQGQQAYPGSAAFDPGAGPYGGDTASQPGAAELQAAMAAAAALYPSPSHNPQGADGGAVVAGAAGPAGEVRASGAAAGLHRNRSVADYEAAAAAAAAAVLAGVPRGQSAVGGQLARPGRPGTPQDQQCHHQHQQQQQQEQQQGEAEGEDFGVQAGGAVDEEALAALARELRQQELLLRQELAALQDGQGWVQDFRREIWPQLQQLLTQAQAQAQGQALPPAAPAAAALAEQPQGQAQGLAEAPAGQQAGQLAATAASSPPQLAPTGHDSRYYTPTGPSFTSTTNPSFSWGAADAPQGAAGEGASLPGGAERGRLYPQLPPQDAPVRVPESRLSTPDGQSHYGSPRESLAASTGSRPLPGASPPRVAAPRLAPAYPPAYFNPPPAVAAEPRPTPAYRGAGFEAVDPWASPQPAAAAEARPPPAYRGAGIAPLDHPPTLGAMSSPKRAFQPAVPVLPDALPPAALYDDAGQDALAAFETDHLRQQLQQLHLAAGLLQTLDPSQLAAAVSAGAQAQMARRGRRPEPPRWIENPAARESVIASQVAAAGRESAVGRPSGGGGEGPPRRLLRRMSSVIRRLLVGPQQQQQA
ncbi:hypothetical protein CHLNCDRAFT_135652 [Chlorella variabilis]|uniref:Uncharacterized protein n=1 Tax=Chlorella variabilis TaxID=554065 RepID=E1ZIP1_CHLVA|nr:hypothetical protein CHLNCDRAFT_135652 [Chlorella variabilis]EFN54191.1 hypothetical protein CHLNCDRAFT_135652 [Chlorella variabilis]|eukprot:XP_005846293.1 hypothetical protein CHLNCDRAFT_135652 [Chlorella variabilis]